MKNANIRRFCSTALATFVGVMLWWYLHAYGYVSLGFILPVVVVAAVVGYEGKVLLRKVKASKASLANKISLVSVALEEMGNEFASLLTKAIPLIIITACNYYFLCIPLFLKARSVQTHNELVLAVLFSLKVAALVLPLVFLGYAASRIQLEEERPWKRFWLCMRNAIAGELLCIEIATKITFFIVQIVALAVIGLLGTIALASAYVLPGAFVEFFQPGTRRREYWLSCIVALTALSVSIFFQWVEGATLWLAFWDALTSAIIAGGVTILLAAIREKIGTYFKVILWPTFEDLWKRIVQLLIFLGVCYERLEDVLRNIHHSLGGFLSRGCEDFDGLNEFASE